MLCLNKSDLKYSKLEAMSLLGVSLQASSAMRTSRKIPRQVDIFSAVKAFSLQNLLKHRESIISFER